MSKIEYNYYLHMTANEEPDIIADIFNNGLQSRYGLSIGSTLAKIDKKDIDARGLDTIMKEYLGDSDQYNTVLLIKIPRDYMAEVLHRDGKIEKPIPLFKKITDSRTVFTPYLIQGCYNRTTDSFINNPNFSPIFDANGLQFSEEQKDSFRSLNKYGWYDFAIKRELLSFQAMYSTDKNNGFIDKIMQEYSQKYGRTYQSKLFDQTQYAELLQNTQNGK